MLRTKILKNHKPGCDGIRMRNEGRISNPWILRRQGFRIDTELRDSLGRAHPNGREEWIRVICLDPHCPAKAIVSLDSILDQID